MCTDEVSRKMSLSRRLFLMRNANKFCRFNQQEHRIGIDIEMGNHCPVPSTAWSRIKQLSLSALIGHFNSRVIRQSCLRHWNTGQTHYSAVLSYSVRCSSCKKSWRNTRRIINNNADSCSNSKMPTFCSQRVLRAPNRAVIKSPGFW
jgi:hypothetical protein